MFLELERNIEMEFLVFNFLLYYKQQSGNCLGGSIRKRLLQEIVKVYMVGIVFQSNELYIYKKCSNDVVFLDIGGYFV